jgi:2-dehydropantoate 2-reductase
MERLASLDADLSLLARGEHGEAILKKGLKLTGNPGGFVPPERIRPFDPAEIYDCVVLTPKCQDLESAMKTVRASISKRSVILTIQNGIDAEEICARYAPPDRIAAGVAYVDAFIEAPGIVHLSSPGKLGIGSWNGLPGEELQSLRLLLEKAGIPAKVPADIRQAKWNKLCWNSVFNPLCLITRSTVGDVRRDPELKNVGGRILSEIQAVGAREGVIIDPASVDRFFGADDKQGSGTLTSRTSMWSDFIRGRPTEVDFLNGAVVRLGLRHGVPTPMNETVVALVHALESSGTAR